MSSFAPGRTLSGPMHRRAGFGQRYVSSLSKEKSNELKMQMQKRGANHQSCVGSCLQVTRTRHILGRIAFRGSIFLARSESVRAMRFGADLACIDDVAAYFLKINGTCGIRIRF